MSKILDSVNARQSMDHLVGLLRSDREATANFVVALAEFDRNGHWVALGYNCLFNFVHRELKMSRSAAFFRTKAAELIQRYPEIVEPLRDGRLCITAIAQLAKVMNDTNRSTILERFFHRSNKAAKEIVAELAPILEPPRRELITALAAVTPGGSTSAVGMAPIEVRSAPTCDSPRELIDRAQAPAANDPDSADLATSTVPPVASNGPASAEPRASCAAPQVEPRDGWTEPLTRELHRLHVTVTRDFLRKLAAARDALAHRRVRASTTPNLWCGRNAEVIEVGLDLILERDARNKGVSRKPQRKQRPSAADHVPARVKREVGERDGWRCQYPLASGGVCGSTRNLQFDHIRPVSLGGKAEVANMRLLCAHHNALAARLVLGDAVMDPFTKRGRTGDAAAES